MLVTCYYKEVGLIDASKWACAIAQHAIVLKTLINDHPALIGIATNTDRWMGIYKAPYEEGWCLLMSDGIMERSTRLREDILAISGESDWKIRSIGFLQTLWSSKVIRNNRDRNGHGRMSDKDIAALVGLTLYRDPTTK